MNEAQIIAGNQSEFLKYLKSRYTLIHMSNVFFRDIHYGVMSYLETHGRKKKYHVAEQITLEVTAALEQAGIFKRIDSQSWLLNYPEFALPKVEKKAS